MSQRKAKKNRLQKRQATTPPIERFRTEAPNPQPSTASRTFDFEAFKRAEYVDRTDVVLLKNFGDTQYMVEYHIRGLSKTDLVKVSNAVEKNRELAALLDLVANGAGGGAKDKIEATAALLGFTEKTPDSLVKEYVAFELGSIPPNKPSGMSDVVKFARAYPSEFTRVCTGIWNLTGKGQLAKKKKPEDSGVIRISGTT